MCRVVCLGEWRGLEGRDSDGFVCAGFVEAASSALSVEHTERSGHVACDAGACSAGRPERGLDAASVSSSISPRCAAPGSR